MKTFKDWIAKYKDADNRLGDLARDVLLDDAFPDHEYLVVEYLENIRACDNAIDTAKDAIKKYKRYMYRQNKIFIRDMIEAHTRLRNGY